MNIIFLISNLFRVLQSKHPEYKPNDKVVGSLGWQTRVITAPDAQSQDWTTGKPYKLPDLGGLPLSLGLGILGMPG